MEKLIHRRATESDSAALCDLMRETPMGSAIRTTQDRGTDFFATSRVQAEEINVWASFEEESGRAVALFSAGSRKVFLGGEIKSVRYLADLRIRPEYRNGLLLARGFQMIRNHVFSEGEWAQTLVLDDNAHAARILTSERAGLPKYQPCGQYRTWFIRNQTVNILDSSIAVRKATPADLVAMLDLQTLEGPSSDFTPLLDFSAMMSEVNFHVALRNNALIGILGVWDESSHRRTLIDDYRLPIQLARPIYNIWAAVRKKPALPKVGASLPAKALTAILCRNRDPKILQALVSSALKEKGTVAIGLDSKDPLAHGLASFQAHCTTAGHYLVGFSGEAPTVSRPFYFDFARL